VYNNCNESHQMGSQTCCAVCNIDTTKGTLSEEVQSSQMGWIRGRYILVCAVWSEMTPLITMISELNLIKRHHPFFWDMTINACLACGVHTHIPRVPTVGPRRLPHLLGACAHDVRVNAVALLRAQGVAPAALCSFENSWKWKFDLNVIACHDASLCAPTCNTRGCRPYCCVTMHHCVL